MVIFNSYVSLPEGTWWWTLINEDFSVLKTLGFGHGNAMAKPRYRTLHPQDASGSRCPGCPTGSAQKSGVSPQPWRFHFWLQSLVKILVTGPQCFFDSKLGCKTMHFKYPLQISMLTSRIGDEPSGHWDRPSDVSYRLTDLFRSRSRCVLGRTTMAWDKFS